MSSNSIVKHFTPVGGNVFADIGFAADEAAKLLDETDQVITERLAIKQQLMLEISHWIQVENLKHADAAAILGVSRPRVSDVVNKKTVKFTIDALVDMLCRAGKSVQVSVH